ncbi:MAG: ABC transporter permease [Bacteroidales bacterium]|nr:ABC transporter permease [Bacteroidales bacterium]
MSHRSEDGGFSGPLSFIAVASIALAVMVMVMSVAILQGFQENITSKVAGFGSHATITSYASTSAYEESPITDDSLLRARLAMIPGVRHVQSYATKGGMVKTTEQIYGIVFRGVQRGSDTTFFASCLIQGRLPSFLSARAGGDSTSNEVLISSTIAARLKLHEGDKMRTYFWCDGSQRSRAFTISGIYRTDLTELDDLYILGDLCQVQRLNGWGEEELIGGYELLLDDLDALNTVVPRVYDILPYHLKLQTIIDSHPALFAWLDLLGNNITLILIIMCLVCVTAIISTMLIMIFEKRTTIGLLRALGATNSMIRRIFLFRAMRIIVHGILLGDVLALTICIIQQQWHPILLDSESYSMSYVPVAISVPILILISLGTLVASLLALILPQTYISRIAPAQILASRT